MAVPAIASAGVLGTKLSTKNKQAIIAGHMGALSVSLEMQGMPCGVTDLTFQNLQTGTKKKVSNYIYKRDPRSSLNLVALTPGQYGLVKASCKIGNTTYRFKDIAQGYGPITVQPGEVVYPGTFSINRAGRTMQGFDLQDHTILKGQAMRQKYPNLAQRFVARPVFTPLATPVNPYGVYARNRR